MNAQVVQQNPGMSRILSCDHLNTRKDLCGSDGNIPEVADRCRHHVQGAPLRRLRFTFDHLICSLGYRPAAITVQEIEVLRYTEPMRVHPAVRPALIVLLALFVMLQENFLIYTCKLFLDPLHFVNNLCYRACNT